MPAHPSNPGSLRVRRQRVATLPAADVHAWLDLEARAIEPNAYASADFVLPAVQHLGGGQGEVLLVERGEGLGRELMGVVVLEARGPRQWLPLPHARALRSIHSFCGSPLIDDAQAPAVWRALLAHLGAGWRDHALALPLLQHGGAQLAALEQAARELGMGLHLSAPRSRAMLLPADMGEAALRRNLGKGYGTIDRRRRKLAEMGRYDWRLLRHGIAEAHVADFLRLEHCGWKGENGSSLQASAAGQAFLHDLVRRFDARGQVFFTEVRLDEVAIASSVNFLCGRTAFAFKAGWDVAYRKQGLGMLNEFELVRQVHEWLPGVEAIDSGAEPDSYIDKLYPGSRGLLTATVLFDAPAHWAMGVVDAVRARRDARAAARAAAAEAAEAAGQGQIDIALPPAAAAASTAPPPSVPSCDSVPPRAGRPDKSPRPARTPRPGSEEASARRAAQLIQQAREASRPAGRPVSRPQGTEHAKDAEDTAAPSVL